MMASPGKVLVSGLVGGIFVVVLSASTVFLWTQEGSQLGSLLPWVTPQLSAAVAAGTAALKKGGSVLRVFSVVVVVLSIALFVSGLLEYSLLVSMVSPGPDVEHASGGDGWIWRRCLVASLLAIPAGAIFGMLFGRGPGSPAGGES